MKKNIVLTILLLLSATACNSNSNSSTSSSSSNKPVQRPIKIVNFDLNYETEEDTYLNLTIFNEQVLLEPKEPSRRDYVFNGWYLDETCENKFEGFNQSVNDDMTLYASWTPFEELTDDVKIDRFIAKVKELSGNVSKATVQKEGLETYYTPIEGSFPFYEEVEYNRYKDITTVDYFYTDENNEVINYAQYQHFYDDQYFYSIFNDIEGHGIDSYKETIMFHEAKIDKYLNIDCMNLYSSLLATLSSQIAYGHSYDELDYSFTLNDTHFDEYSESYECELDYYTYIESPEVGAVEEVYMMEFGFTFVNGKIKRSRVVEQYMLGIQGEVQCAIENNIYTTYEVTEEYQDFKGARLDPSDFNYNKQ